MLVFSILLVTTCGFYTSTAAILVEDVGIGRMTLSDYILTEDLLWMSPCSSLLRCAVACVDDDRCVGFTVTRLNKTGVQCRGHGGNLKGAEWSPGSRLFVLPAREALSSLTSPLSITTDDPDVATTESVVTTAGTSWLQQPCVETFDCATVQPNVVCFNALCLCIPGYYYSWTSDSCVAECSQENLQTPMLEYVNWIISGNNDLSVYDISLEACREQCLNNPACRTMEYRAVANDVSDTWCGNSYSTALQLPLRWIASAGRSHYQRTCV